MSINVGNVFSAKNLSEYIYKSLPKEPTPQIRNPYDAIALLSHACMLAVDFRLVGLGEDHKIGISPNLTYILPKKLRPSQKQSPTRNPPKPSLQNGMPPPATPTPSAMPTRNPPSSTSLK